MRRLMREYNCPHFDSLLETLEPAKAEPQRTPRIEPQYDLELPIGLNNTYKTAELLLQSAEL